MMRSDRAAHPDEGLANPENLGFVPTETLLLWSEDAGHTWAAPSRWPPLVGPSFELCCPIVPLRDGRWFLPTSTWRGWDGDCPNGMKMVAFVSHDGGRSWPEYRDVMRDPEQRIIYWESKICEMPDGRLLAVAWVYDQVAAADLPNHYAISADGGNSWSLHSRRACKDRRRLRTCWKTAACCWSTAASIAQGYGPTCRTWREIVGSMMTRRPSGARRQRLTGDSDNMVQNFQVLRFGAPVCSASTMARSSWPSGATKTACRSSGGTSWRSAEVLWSRGAGRRASDEPRVSREEVRAALTGPVTSVKIPFHRDGSIDFVGLRTYIEFVLAAGSRALILTYGDSLYSVLSDQEVAEVTRAVVEAAAGRALVVAGDRMWATPQAVAFAAYAREAGAASS